MPVVAYHYQHAPVPKVEKRVIVSFNYEPGPGLENWSWDEDRNGNKTKGKAIHPIHGDFGEIRVDEMLNRMIKHNHQNYIHLSFRNLKSDDATVAEAYKNHVKTILTNGIKYGEQTYVFCGHSHSQLRTKSCFMYATNNHLNVRRMINNCGDFGKIQNVAKLSKKIGHLFTTAEQSVCLGGNEFAEMDDIVHDGRNFTDGFGIISQDFAAEIAEKYYRESRHPKFSTEYIPQILQISYKGYTGTLVVQKEEEMKKMVMAQPVTAAYGKKSILMNIYLWILSYFCFCTKSEIKVMFRKSMKKFDKCSFDDLCILKRSKPSKPAKLNADIIPILSALGIQDEIFERKLDEFLKFIARATKSKQGALEFMKYKGHYKNLRQIRNQDAELDKIPPRMYDLICTSQANELNACYSKEKIKNVFIMIPKSRFLFGVADISGKLKPGECYVRYTTDKRNLNSAELRGRVLVARTPCLHPGDIQVYKAVTEIPELEHLVDCIVFSTAGGKCPPTSKMSGEDFNGDKLFVCWDPDLIPQQCVEPLDHAEIESKSGKKNEIGSQQLDLIDYFVNYDITQLEYIDSLYKRWIRIKPEGAFSEECQRLNLLYCKCGNGENVEIPQDLLNPSTQTHNSRKRFILDILTEQIKMSLKTRDFKFIEKPAQGQGQSSPPKRPPQSPKTHQSPKPRFFPRGQNQTFQSRRPQTGLYQNSNPGPALGHRAPAHAPVSYNRVGYGHYNYSGTTGQNYQYTANNYYNNNNRY